MAWKTRLANLVIALAIVILCIPLAMAVTILTFPFWCWIETRYAIESCGHSGPAEWCYLVVYAGILILAGIIRISIGHESTGKANGKDFQ